MVAPSLGEMLRAQAGREKAKCLRDLEQKAAEKGACGERDLQLVKDFFHQAMTHFASSILARVEVRPLVLGNGNNAKVAAILQTFRWKADKDIRNSDHPYHAVWTRFQTWCDENDLNPEIEPRRDRNEQWHIVTVSPVISELPSASEVL
jgi:hypothetical protein